MKDTKKFFTIFPLFFIAAAFTSGCSSPIGGLQVDNTSNYIQCRPNKILYRLSNDDPFKAEHMEVIYFFEGRKKNIDIIHDENLKITITDTSPLSENPGPTPVNKNEEFVFPTKGKYNVGITYLGMKDDYSIQVVAPGEFPGWDGDGLVIIINWPK